MRTRRELGRPPREPHLSRIHQGGVTAEDPIEGSKGIEWPHAGGPRGSCGRHLSVRAKKREIIGQPLWSSLVNWYK